MNLCKLKLELNKCKTQRESFDKRLTKRKKLIEYFNLKKQIRLQIIKKFAVIGLSSSLLSLSLFFTYPILSNMLLTFAFSTIPVIMCQYHIFKKFNKVIKAIENNNKKITAKMQELLQNEFELDMQIKNLQNESQALNKTGQIATKTTEKNQQFTI